MTDHLRGRTGNRQGRRRVAASAGIGLLCLLGATNLAPAQEPDPGRSPGFAGRWLVEVGAPNIQALPLPMSLSPVAIIDIAVTASGVSVTVVDQVFSGMSPEATLTVARPTATGGRITLQADVFGARVLMQGEKVGARIQGWLVVDGDSTSGLWSAERTTGATVFDATTIAMVGAKKAYWEAGLESPAERSDALSRLLQSYPDLPQQEEMRLQLARTSVEPRVRASSLREFLARFPRSAYRELVRLDLATSLDSSSERAVALGAFVAEFPTSLLKTRAEFELTHTFEDPAQREAALEAFTRANPGTPFASTATRELFEAAVRRRPVDEARLLELMNALIAAAPETPVWVLGSRMNPRAETLNLVADRLMANDVMLDKALGWIRQAIALTGEKDESTRGTYATTLGQVLYKMKDYAEAERQLKRAIAISPKTPSGVVHLFLGKSYEATGRDEAALAVYLEGVASAASNDLSAALERLWIKRHGSTDGLDGLIEEKDTLGRLAFDPGRYTRPRNAASDRVVLVETFSGVDCRTCVATDVAVSALAKRYGRDTVTLLEYHLNASEPDPLANTDGARRAAYYGIRSGPAWIVDGLAPKAEEGNVSRASMAFADIGERIETRLTVPARAALQGFRATLDGSRLLISGEARLRPSATAAVKKPVLRMALVQMVVRYKGASGVSAHLSVLRGWIGSAAGSPINPNGAKRKMAESAALSTLSAINPARLAVVVFVQDDVTKEILQSVFVTPAR